MRFLQQLRDRPYLLLSLASLSWAGSSVVGRAIVDEVPPVLLADLRWGLAFLLILPFAWSAISSDLAVIRRSIGILLLLSLTGISTFNTLLYWSLQYTTAINATLMQSSAPLLIGLWSLVLFREPLTRGQLGGIVVSLAGIATIVSEGDPARLLTLELNVGDIVVVIAMIFYALYSALLRKRPAMAPLSFLAVTMGIGTVLLLPVTIAEAVAGARMAPLNAGTLAALVYVVVFPSIVAYLCFNRGVQLIGPNRAGPFFHLIPLFGVLLAIAFLGERPALHHAVGAVLIVGGVVLASRRPAEPRRNRVAPAGERQ
jgi:drug/metabolite transporter (DMT)-like permease